MSKTLTPKTVEEELKELYKTVSDFQSCFKVYKEALPGTQVHVAMAEAVYEYDCELRDIRARIKKNHPAIIEE